MSKLTPEQRQQVMQQAAMQANQQIMQDMMQRSILHCFKRCAGTSVRRLLVGIAIVLSTNSLLAEEVHSSK